MVCFFTSGPVNAGLFLFSNKQETFVTSLCYKVHEI